jgi:hypothetical protein
VLLALAAALLWATAASAAVEISLSEDYPLRGVPATLQVSEDGAPLAGVVVEALYRPNSQTSRSETLPATGADGTVSWTPEDAGIVQLTARRGSSDEAEPLAVARVAVRFGGFPTAGLVIMIAAGLLLFGGAITGFILLLTAPPSGEPAETPPST